MKTTSLRLILAFTVAASASSSAWAKVVVTREEQKVAALLTGQDALDLWSKLTLPPVSSPGGFGQVNYLKLFESGGEAPRFAIFCYDFHGRQTELFCRLSMTQSELAGVEAQRLYEALAGGPDRRSFITAEKELVLSCGKGASGYSCRAVLKLDP